MAELEIKIIAEPMLDPNVCKFTVDRPLYPKGSFNCTSRELAKGSPLLEALFLLTGVSQVQVTDNVVTIAKSGAESWPVLAKQVGVVIREEINKSLSTGELMISEETLLKAKEKTPEPDLNTPAAQAIQKVLDDQINTAVAGHGGYVSLVDVKDHTAYIRMEGGCQGCGMADVTLKQGIEVAIKQAVPEIEQVLDVTDHASGHNPYYEPSK